MRGFDESFPVANNEDTDLSYRIAAAGHVMVFNPDAVVSHLRHPDSLRRYIRQKFWRGYWRMIVYRRHPGKMVKDTYTPRRSSSRWWRSPPPPLRCRSALFFRPALALAAISLLLFLASAAPFASWRGAGGTRRWPRSRPCSWPRGRRPSVRASLVRARRPAHAPGVWPGGF